MSEKPYLRIATSYFKIVKIPNLRDEFNETLVKWDLKTIIRDHNSKYVADIPKYDGSVCFPDHFDFSKEIHGFYNTYSELNHKPKQGDIKNTMIFFKHIFGKQVELGLDYFKLLYENPTQPLPILCLVSIERSTGKSTFLKYLKEVFGNNMTYLDSNTLNSNFNLDWGNKLLLAIDEAQLDSEQLIEKIKFLSTSNKNKIEAKGKERFEVDFFGHFIMCSNNEDSFAKVDAVEERFWVIKIPQIKTEVVDFLNKLVNEIPAFLEFTLNRNFASERKTRMWFTPQEIYTPALKKLMDNNRTRVEKELAHILFNVMEKFDWDEVSFVLSDIQHALGKTRVKTDFSQLRKLVRKEWKLSNKSNSLQYEKFTILNDGEIIKIDSKGRYYTITKLFLIENFDELMTDI